ncbi:LCP family protein [Aliibacillus thermotolerans]|uniref:LCP family protein n=1 Tax=Aliibacillus thermotolerans TaxID=1834418 RepID=A0ABW0U853_9BACI|nr:LCP family protein [Aliibacillus thermotolerans]MDA3130938.1 LytR family transcriptional regulator [Aliibacillus thermotolerans]
MAKQVPRTRMARRKRRARFFIKTILFIGFMSFLVLGGTIGYFAWKLSDVAADTQELLKRGEKSERREEAVNPKQDNISVLFIGVDNRDGDLDGLSDALLLATFNKNDPSIKLTSIPRDSLVNIPHHGQDKITHAHAFGGVDLTVQTVEELLDIPVDYYVKLNFEAFIEIVDALNGVEVDVAKSFYEQDSYGNHNAIFIEEGKQVLSGEEALAYARMRKNDPQGDIGRGQRQQEIIESLIRKSASISSIRHYDDVLQSVEEHMTMNLSFGNLIALHQYAGAINHIEKLQLKGENLYMNNVYYYQLDEQHTYEISQQLKAHLEIEDSDPYSTPGASVQTEAETFESENTY